MTVVREELEKMPEKTRVIFRMSKFGGYSNDEIATKMHLSAKAVEYHITQAVKKLRIRLAVFLS
jgi:RNA polymerase sigma-70 factor (ECF subfamily)